MKKSMSMTRDEAIKHLKDKVENIIEEGSEDQAAWEYRADLLDAIKQIEQGADIEETLGNI